MPERAHESAPCALCASPVGIRLGNFVFEYLSGAHEWRALSDARPSYALHMLANVDAQLSATWRRLLTMPADELVAAELTLDSFDDALPDTPLTRANVGRAGA